VETGPNPVKHKSDNAKCLKTDAVQTASVGGSFVPRNLRRADAVQTASANVGSEKGYKLASGKFVFEGVGYSLNEVRSTCKGRKVLHYSSGPRRVGDFAEASDELGAVAKSVDIEIDGTCMDLLDEAVAGKYWEEIRSKSSDATLMSMLSSTFSGVGTDDGGPAPLRGAEGKDIYGFPGLSLKDRERVSSGTILALRGTAIAKACLQADIPCLAETPELKEGSP